MLNGVRSSLFEVLSNEVIEGEREGEGRATDEEADGAGEGEGMTAYTFHATIPSKSVSEWQEGGRERERSSLFTSCNSSSSGSHSTRYIS